MQINRSLWQSPPRLALAVVIFLGLGGGLPAGEAKAQEIGQQGYVLATATSGGTYYPVGVALSTLVKLKLLPDYAINLTAIETAGSTDNLQLLREDKAQFAILLGLFGYYSRTGTGPMVGQGPSDDLRAIATLWPNADHFVMRKDQARTGTIDDFLSLQGQPVYLGKQNSGALVLNRLLLESLGVDIDRDFALQYLSHEEGANALAQGQLAGASLTGGLPVDAVTSLSEQTGEAMQILEFSDEQLTRIDAGRGIWSRQMIPANTYPGQGRALQSIGTANFLAVRADIDEEAVYQITKGIFDNLPFLHHLHDATRQITLENAARGLPVPLHPGALRYYREHGVPLPVEAAKAFLARYQSPDEARVHVNRSTVGIITDGAGTTSAQMATELAAVLDQGDDMRVVAINGKGSAQNITDLLYLKGVDAAVIQADVLEYAEDERAYPGLTSQITYIARLCGEEMHLLARGDIRSIRDLAGRKVNFGSPGSGDELTAAILFNQLNIPVERTALDQSMALDKLKRGEIAAAVYVSGKPMPLLQQIGFDEGLHLLPVPAVDYAGAYAPARLTFDDYPNLIAASEDVATFTVDTVLAAYNWTPNSARYGSLERFIDGFFRSAGVLQAAGRHDKWRELDLDAELPGWQRFAAAKSWLARNPDVFGE